MALICFLVASEIGGNPFVAAFIGGFAFGAAAPTDAKESTELTEMLGSLLSLVLWFIFGAGFVLPALQHLDARIVLYALLSLTFVRMVPVAISFIGAGRDRATTAFVGWFGPRGLASVVFALLAVEELGGADPRVLAAVHTIAVTILFSVVAHGITARPLAARYVRRNARVSRGRRPRTRRNWCRQCRVAGRLCGRVCRVVIVVRRGACRANFVRPVVDHGGVNHKVVHRRVARAEQHPQQRQPAEERAQDRTYRGAKPSQPRSIAAHDAQTHEPFAHGTAVVRPAGRQVEHQGDGNAAAVKIPETRGSRSGAEPTM